MNVFSQNKPLTWSQICGNMCRAANNPKEPACSWMGIWADPDCNGAGAGEGAGDGGAKVVTITIVIFTKKNVTKAAVALGGRAIIDLNPVLRTVGNGLTNGLNKCTDIYGANFQTVKGEGDCLSIGWLQLPSLQQSIQCTGRQPDHSAIAITWS